MPVKPFIFDDGKVSCQQAHPCYRVISCRLRCQNWLLSAAKQILENPFQQVELIGGCFRFPVPVNVKGHLTVQEAEMAWFMRKQGEFGVVVNEEMGMVAGGWRRNSSDLQKILI